MLFNIPREEEPVKEQGKEERLVCAGNCMCPCVGVFLLA